MAITLRSLSAATAAGGLGVVLVAAGAQSTEAFSSLPTFSLGKERYDMSTMMGRYCKQLSNCDPTTLFASESQIRQAEVCGVVLWFSSEISNLYCRIYCTVLNRVMLILPVVILTSGYGMHRNLFKVRYIPIPTK